MRAGGIVMLYPLNVPFFHSPVASIFGVTSPISFPVTPAFFSASVTFFASAVSLYVTVSRSMILKGLSVAPRFFASPAIADCSSALRPALSRSPFSVPAAFFRSSAVTAMREGTAAPVYSAFFSAFILSTPSLESIPNALPMSLFSMESAAAISGSVFAPFSFTSAITRSSTVPVFESSRPVSVISK